jgi:hypothetical protein
LGGKKKSQRLWNQANVLFLFCSLSFVRWWAVVGKMVGAAWEDGAGWGSVIARLNKLSIPAFNPIQPCVRVSPLASTVVECVIVV